MAKTAVTPTRSENYADWYQNVIRAADLAECAPVRGCMIIKPWGYGIWERIQKILDAKIREMGVSNAYFPLFIPLSFLEREAEHVEGFAKECAIVTHHRLEAKDGKLIPKGPLEEPLVVRPTSEAIIGDAFSRWISSHRDLPLMVNQWANIVRWEMRTRVFLRTTEFLWQEGHTAHATKEEALGKTMEALELYRWLAETVLAMPVILGEKSPAERFPGAENTFCMEAMMQDCKALQAGTTHYLGQNFSKVFGIRFCDQDGDLKFAYTSSWGVSTRLMGGLVMTHGDDNGMRVPPIISPEQIVILAIVPSEEHRKEVLAYAHALAADLRLQSFAGESVRVLVDDRDRRGGEKNWEWIKKGVPIRVEVGPKDIEKRQAVIMRRDCDVRDKEVLSLEKLTRNISALLEDIQSNYFQQALAFRDRNMHGNIETLQEMQDFFDSKGRGFILGKWCEDPKTEALLDQTKISIRCLPLKSRDTEGACLLTGKIAKRDAIFAKAY